MSARVHIRVEDVMTTTLHSIDGLATVADAMDLMQRHDVDALAVNRHDETDEVGLLLVSHIARHVIALHRSPERVNVYEIMSRPALTLPPDMLVRHAVGLLVQFDVSSAIVVDHQRDPLGFVTLHDLVVGRPPE